MNYIRKPNRISLKKAVAAFCVVVCLFLLLPFPFRDAGGETYRCAWSDGTVTTESYTSAYAALYGIDEDGVVLYRDGKLGKLTVGITSVYSVLESGNLGEILSCVFEGGARIEKAALYRTFSGRVWYADGFFVWTGDRVERAERAEGNELVLLDGSISSETLRSTNASTVYLRASAEVTADMFWGTGVKEVYALPPYFASGGAVYLKTAGGTRLLTALGSVETLAIDPAVDFMDEGALLSCERLKTLTLPFAGNMKESAGSAFCGEIAYLFSDGREYFVPGTLERIEVTGGILGPDAFYRLDSLREINVCGVAEENISPAAFQGLPALELLHSPKKVTLEGFTSMAADCGCTVYTKIV